MAEPKKSSESKPKQERAKITFFEAIRRVELAMRDLDSDECLKLIEYAQMHVKSMAKKAAKEPVL